MSENDTAFSRQSAERGLDLPPAWVSVWVACGSVRCLAYRTANGEWVSTFSGEPLTGVTGWSMI
jgi:hypothetical protein